MKIIRIIIPIVLILAITCMDVKAFQVEREIGIVRRFKPDVTVTNLDKNKYKELNLSEDIGERLYSGDSLFTDSEGFALVYFMDKSIAKVKPNSLLIINGDVELSSKVSNTMINLQRGELFLQVQPQGSNEFEVYTSRTLASVKGTDFGSKSDGYVWVEEGQVDVTALNSGQTISLFEEMYAQVDEDGNNIDSGMLSQAQLRNLNTGYDEMATDLIPKEIILKFRDQNGQLREIRVNVYEEGQN
ncbi:FecR domain-containing protein [Gracilimonas sp. Q87]|uniref:FecR domain-containing protein n=1 Tax=Gracilimonas sp. Q87 TaxID=3384766 RepID=UPI0039846133